MPHKDPIARREYGRMNKRRYDARRTAIKVAALQARIAARPRWPELDLAWAAGMFEGEGTITTVGNGKYSRSVVSLANTDPEIVAYFQSRWPGCVAKKKMNNPRHRQAWTWRLGGNRTIGFLEDVLPYLRTSGERRKAELLLEAQRARWVGYRLEGHMERMAAYRDEFRRLNRKGPPIAP